MVYRGTLSSRCDRQIDDIDAHASDATSTTIVIYPEARPSLFIVKNDGGAPVTVTLPGERDPFGRIELQTTTVAAGTIAVIPFGAVSLGGFPTVVTLSTITDVKWLAFSLGDSPLNPSTYIAPIIVIVLPDLDEGYEYAGGWPGTSAPPAPVFGGSDLVEGYEAVGGWPV